MHLAAYASERFGQLGIGWAARVGALEHWNAGQPTRPTNQANQPGQPVKEDEEEDSGSCTHPSGTVIYVAQRLSGPGLQPNPQNVCHRMFAIMCVAIHNITYDDGAVTVHGYTHYGIRSRNYCNGSFSPVNQRWRCVYCS